jgi:hypothetical protein
MQNSKIEESQNLSPKAEELLGLIEKYRFYRVTNQQYAHLMMLSRQKTIRYINELVEKNRIKPVPESRRAGRGRVNKYLLIGE